MRPGVPADLQSAVLRVSGFIIRNTPILYIVRIENPDAQSNRITNPIKQVKNPIEQISADTPRRNSKVKLKAIQFRSDKKLKQSVGYIKIKQMKRVKHSAKLSEIEIDMRLKEYFSDHQIMQRSDFQGITGMVRSTAMIHIRRLRQEGKLQNIGIPSQPIYVPAPGFYGKSRDYQPVK